MCSVFLRSTYVYLLFYSLRDIHIVQKGVGRSFFGFHIVKRYTRPLACGLLERRKKKSDWWWWWGQNIFLLTSRLGFSQHSVIQSFAVRRTGRTCFIFWEKKSARRFPEFSLFFLGFLFFYKEFLWFCLLKRGGQLELLCFVFITVDDLLKSVGFFAFRDTAQEFTVKHSRYILLFLNRRSI